MGLGATPGPQGMRNTVGLCPTGQTLTEKNFMHQSTSLRFVQVLMIRPAAGRKLSLGNRLQGVGKTLQSWERQWEGAG